MYASALGTAHLFDVSSDPMLDRAGATAMSSGATGVWFIVALQVAGSGVIAQAGREAILPL
jgi:hypothetical protein